MNCVCCKKVIDAAYFVNGKNVCSFWMELLQKFLALISVFFEALPQKAYFVKPRLKKLNL